MAFPAASSTRCSNSGSTRTRRAHRCPPGDHVATSYLLLSGLAEWSTSWPVGFDCGGVGRLVAAPVVVPGSVLAFGMVVDGDAGLAGWFCALCDGGVVPALLTDVLF